MIRKCHNHKPQTTPWHHEEEPLNHHETPGRQIKQSNQLSPPNKMIAILEWTKSNVQQNIEQLQTNVQQNIEQLQTHKVTIPADLIALNTHKIAGQA